MTENKQLALIETGLAGMDRVAAGLAELASKYQGVVFDCSTAAGMEAAREARRNIKRPRVEVERIRREAKAPILELGRRLDSEAQRITRELEALENPIDQQIVAEENRIEAERQAKVRAEQERVAAIQRRIEGMEALLKRAAIARASGEIAELMNQVDAVEIDDSFAEAKDRAADTKSRVYEELDRMHAAAIAREQEAERLAAERAELDRQRQEQEARAKRATEVQERLAELRGCPTLTATSGAALIAEHIGDLDQLPVTVEIFADFLPRAIEAKLAGMNRLRALHIAALEHEAAVARQQAESERISKEREELAAAQRAEQERKDREEQARRDEEARQTREQEDLAAAHAAEISLQEIRDFVPSLEAVVDLLSKTYQQTPERVMEWLPVVVNGSTRKAA